MDESTRTVDLLAFAPVPPPPIFLLKQEANRFGMAGAAGNVTRGAFLVKLEMAYLFGIRTLRFDVRPGSPAPFLNQERDRLDTMVGLEWYGPDQLTVAVEIVNRHLFDHPGGPPGVIELTPADGFETAVRVTRPFSASAST